jgi:hypothetical protein
MAAKWSKLKSWAYIIISGSTTSPQNYYQQEFVHEEDYHAVMMRGIKKIITSVVDGMWVNIDIDRGRAAWRFVWFRARSMATSTNMTNGALRGWRNTLPATPMCATGIAPLCTNNIG